MNAVKTIEWTIQTVLEQVFHGRVDFETAPVGIPQVQFMRPPDKPGAYTDMLECRAVVYHGERGQGNELRFRFLFPWTQLRVLAGGDGAKSSIDTEMLDWMDRQTGSYTNRVIWRWSAHGRGWRLHETDMPGATRTVREAIQAGMVEEADANKTD